MVEEEQQKQARGNQTSQSKQVLNSETPSNNDYKDTLSNAKINIDSPLAAHEKDAELSPPRMRSSLGRQSVGKLGGLVTVSIKSNPIQEN
eukprot:CAMPEP_0185599512 /NCGR_PEP_ID=MMETSP0434-20130131/82759_1 /TAXON_ID=626734 ORGANISM="Favella taraikaensis, Strain Fe Narragansett Bay" /NCGR_SAMPLE_ID=MMETSP0434 /ASSEMBLY_ACC=CAM_ASM_000379 /LENGTH=89 /DNA_ID=CAMNT_0028228949 /DNA_START=1715 /DNA_END=1984 /DNA_ORIENTATION=+